MNTEAGGNTSGSSALPPLISLFTAPTSALALSCFALPASLVLPSGNSPTSAANTLHPSSQSGGVSAAASLSLAGPSNSTYIASLPDAAEVEAELDFAASQQCEDIEEAYTSGDTHGEAHAEEWASMGHWLRHFASATTATDSASSASVRAIQSAAFLPLPSHPVPLTPFAFIPVDPVLSCWNCEKLGRTTAAHAECLGMPPATWVPSVARFLRAVVFLYKQALKHTNPELNDTTMNNVGLRDLNSDLATELTAAAAVSTAPAVTAPTGVPALDPHCIEHAAIPLVIPTEALAAPTLALCPLALRRALTQASALFWGPDAFAAAVALTTPCSQTAQPLGNANDRLAANRLDVAYARLQRAVGAVVPYYTCPTCDAAPLPMAATAAAAAGATGTAAGNGSARSGRGRGRGGARGQISSTGARLASTAAAATVNVDDADDDDEEDEDEAVRVRARAAGVGHGRGKSARDRRADNQRIGMSALGADSNSNKANGSQNKDSGARSTTSGARSNGSRGGRGGSNAAGNRGRGRHASAGCESDSSDSDAGPGSAEPASAALPPSPLPAGARWPGCVLLAPSDRSLYRNPYWPLEAESAAAFNSACSVTVRTRIASISLARTVAAGAVALLSGAAAPAPGAVGLSDANESVSHARAAWTAVQTRLDKHRALAQHAAALDHALALSPPQFLPPRCAACLSRGGIMRPTADGSGLWVHPICVVYTPELFYRGQAPDDEVRGLSAALLARRSLQCGVCRIKGGACVQCDARHCYTALHVTCGLRAGLLLRDARVRRSYQADPLDPYSGMYSAFDGTLVGRVDGEANDEETITGGADDRDIVLTDHDFVRLRAKGPFFGTEVSALPQRPSLAPPSQTSIAAVAAANGDIPPSNAVGVYIKCPRHTPHHCPVTGAPLRPKLFRFAAGGDCVAPSLLAPGEPLGGSVLAVAPPSPRRAATTAAASASNKASAPAPALSHTQSDSYAKSVQSSLSRFSTVPAGPTGVRMSVISTRAQPGEFAPSPPPPPQPRAHSNTVSTEYFTVQLDGTYIRRARGRPKRISPPYVRTVMGVIINTNEVVREGALASEFIRNRAKGLMSGEDITPERPLAHSPARNAAGYTPKSEHGSPATSAPQSPSSARSGTLNANAGSAPVSPAASAFASANARYASPSSRAGADASLTASPGAVSGPSAPDLQDPQLRPSDWSEQSAEAAAYLKQYFRKSNADDSNCTSGNHKSVLVSDHDDFDDDISDKIYSNNDSEMTANKDVSASNLAASTAAAPAADSASSSSSASVVEIDDGESQNDVISTPADCPTPPANATPTLRSVSRLGTAGVSSSDDIIADASSATRSVTDKSAASGSPSSSSHALASSSRVNRVYCGVITFDDEKDEKEKEADAAKIAQPVTAAVAAAAAAAAMVAVTAGSVAAAAGMDDEFDEREVPPLAALTPVRTPSSCSAGAGNPGSIRSSSRRSLAPALLAVSADSAVPTRPMATADHGNSTINTKEDSGNNDVPASAPASSSAGSPTASESSATGPPAAAATRGNANTKPKRPAETAMGGNDKRARPANNNNNNTHANANNSGNGSNKAANGGKTSILNFFSKVNK